MAKKTDKFLDTVSEGQARTEKALTDKAEKTRKRMRDLYDSDKDRDEDIFRLLGVDPSILLRDYEAISVFDRNPNWSAGLSAMLSAARVQTWIELVQTSNLLGMFAQIATRIERERAKLDKDELSAAAIEGVSKARLARSREALRGIGVETPDFMAPLSRGKMPQLDDMRKMSKGELLQTLEQYGVTQPWGQMQMSVQDYVSRMTEYRPGSPEWQAEVDRLLDRENGRALLGMTRRAQQQYTSLEYIGGDVDMEMIWVSEGDDNTCQNCETRAGQVKTFKQWQVEGPPGAGVCLGGDQCRCDLVPY